MKTALQLYSSTALQLYILQPTFMTSFKTRNTVAGTSIGHRLKILRRSFGLTIDDVVYATRIRKPLLCAIERGAFCEIPEHFYRTIIVKTYSEYLGCSWDLLENEYKREVMYTAPNHHEAPTPKTTIQKKDLVVAPRLIKNITLGFGMIGAVAYLFFLAYGALQPPHLTVSNPPDNYESRGHSTVVEGAVPEGSDVSINGQRVLKRNDGTFRQEVILSPGVNIINVSAAKKYSKETVVTRKVLYQEQSITN